MSLIRVKDAAFRCLVPGVRAATYDQNVFTPQAFPLHLVPHEKSKERRKALATTCGQLRADCSLVPGSDRGLLKDPKSVPDISLELQS